MLEKALMRRGEGRGGVECVFDAVRCMIVVPKMQMVREVLEDFLQLHYAREITVVRVKDRFAKPTGDIPLNSPSLS